MTRAATGRSEYRVIAKHESGKMKGASNFAGAGRTKAQDVRIPQPAAGAGVRIDRRNVP